MLRSNDNPKTNLPKKIIILSENEKENSQWAIMSSHDENKNKM